MKKNRLSLAFLSLLIAASPLRAQDTLQNETVEQKDKRMEWFSQAKLGIFIHWGIYSVRGVSESWSFFNNYLPYDEYMEQEKGFTASKYDPKAWVDLIKESGAKYTVITTKHHDGVALWDTKVGDISVVKSTPAKRDLIAPFVKEVRKQGLKLGFYYSLLDWSHPDYPNKTRTEVRYKNDPERWARFNKFNFGQLAELNKTWKPDLYWFDGDWEQSAEAWNSKGIVDLLRSENKNVIINSRIQGYGDYATPEQGVPVAGKSKVDDEVLDNLEEVLITSDVGVETTLNIIKRIEKRAAADKYVNTQELNHILRDEIAALLTENNSDDVADFDVPITRNPYVIMVVGVNGVGKTTTIGKLAYQFKKAGKSVYLGAADTFRAAAVEQLMIWGERVGVPVVKQKMGADPASVAYDTLSSAVANNADVVIIDTAGRLHNKVGLMNELTKIKNVMKKVVPDAPDEVLLVLDGSTGQNAFEQAKQFTLATEVTAMAITKLDGTAKGGVVIGISDQFKIPVKYIGLGEGMEDLQVFRKNEFVDSLFGENA